MPNMHLYTLPKTLFYEPDGKDPVEPERCIKKAEPEDEAEPEPPQTEEDEVNQDFMADEHDDYPDGFIERTWTDDSDHP